MALLRQIIGCAKLKAVEWYSWEMALRLLFERNKDGDSLSIGKHKGRWPSLSQGSVWLAVITVGITGWRVEM
jgi:hypothetical protein